MDPSCLRSKVQAEVVYICYIFSWHTLGLLIPIEHHLNTTVYPNIVADHVHLFMTTVWWILPSSQSSNHLKLVSWSWQWVTKTQTATVTTRSQSSRADLGFSYSYTLYFSLWHTTMWQHSEMHHGTESQHNNRQKGKAMSVTMPKLAATDIPRASKSSRLKPATR